MRLTTLKNILSGLLILIFAAACGPALAPLPTPTATPAAVATDTSAPVQPTPTLTATITSAPVKSLQVLGTFPSIQSIRMLDANNGWGLTQDQVLRTNDGGTSWYNATPAGMTDAGQTSTFFLNDTTAWVVASGGDPTSGTIYHTADGGANWTSTAVPFGGGSMQFIGPTNGWILVGLGVAMSHEAVAVFRTSDGGATWSQVFTDAPQAVNTNDSLPFVGDKSGLAASDNDHAWVTGSEPMSDFIYLYSTQDGGRTWTGQTAVLPAAYAGAMTGSNPPRIFPGSELVLPVGIYANTAALVLYTSRDLGKTWIAGAPVPINGSASLPTPTDFFAWDGGPALYVSQDGGATWATVATDVNLKDSLSSFQFVDANTGWAITSDAAGNFTLYRTQNGGVEWDVLNP